MYIWISEKCFFATFTWVGSVLIKGIGQASPQCFDQVLEIPLKYHNQNQENK